MIMGNVTCMGWQVWVGVGQNLFNLGKPAWVMGLYGGFDQEYYSVVILYIILIL